MKNAVVFLFGIFLAACGGNPKSVRAEGGVTFDISPEILDSRADTTVMLGTVRAGEVIEYEAWLRNASDRPMVIIGMDTSCGCTSVEYERQAIAPGEKGRFSFRFDSRGQWGTQLKLIEIRTSVGSEKYKLYINAEVEEAGL